jgi:hypothetical protein
LRTPQAGLSAAGFEPWIRFGDLDAELQVVPTNAAGVYVVLRNKGDDAPSWVTPSPVGETWLGDPTVSVEALEANWVPGASVVYVGKAKESQLRKRLRAYLRFGQARGGRHWGGRLIWQLPDPWDLLVAWRVEAEQDALDVERGLLGSFRDAYGGQPPFANNPDRLGR